MMLGTEMGRWWLAGFGLWMVAVLCAVPGCSSGESSGSRDATVVDATEVAEADAAVRDVPGETGQMELPERVGDDGGDDMGEDREGPGDSLDQDVVPNPCDRQAPGRIVAGARDETFDLGPYLMWAQPTRITILWRTSEEEDGVVQYGFEDLSQEVRHEENARVHKVTLTDLVPDTRYQYRVTSGGVTSQVHHFHTAVHPGQGFRFAVFGDNQNGPEGFVRIVEQMLAVHPYLLVGVGDHVQEGKKEWQWREQLFDPARALFHEVPLYAAMGNHEQHSPVFWELYAYDHPPGEEGFNLAYYSYSYGNAFFLVLDTNNLLCPLGEVDVPQSAWLKEQLASPAARNATWKFAYSHEPGYSESWSPGDCDYDGNRCIRNWLLPLLSEHGFHAYFSGHTHGYERGRVGDVLHFINGGAGGGLDEWCKDLDQTTVVIQSHHFILADAGCDRLRFQAITIDGELVDWVEISPDRMVLDEGPVAGLPELIISTDSPHYQPQP